jgi:4-amino-4-deoxy-L-arabinose transferase-like glycosyltransferase
MKPGLRSNVIQVIPNPEVASDCERYGRRPTAPRPGMGPRPGLWRAGYLLVIVALYLGVGVFDHDFWPPVEHTVAGVTWQMARTGELAIPRINGLPYLEKPPLAYALSMFSCRIAGRLTPGFVRLPATVAGLLTLGLLFWTGRRLYGEAVAWLVTLLCATSFSFYAFAHRASTDGIALLFVAACFALFLCTLDDPRVGTPALRSAGATDLALAVTLAASFFVKNLFTFLIVLPPVVLFLLFTRQLRRLAMFLLLTALAFVVLVGPWVAILFARGGSQFLRIVFFDNTLGRFLTISDWKSLDLGPLNDAFYIHKGRTVRVAFDALVSHMLPWLPIYLASLWALVRDWRRWDEPTLFLTIALACIMLAVSLSASKVGSYYLPVAFVLPLIAGDLLAKALTQADSASAWRWWIVHANLGLVVAGAVAAPVIAGIWLEVNTLPWLVLPGLAGAVLLWVRFRRYRETLAPLAVCLVALCATLTLLIAMPYIDELRSWRPFFEEVRVHAFDREVWTTVLDDRRLPAMNFYLDRPLRVLGRPDNVAGLMRSGRKVGVLLWQDQYDAQEGLLASIPHQLLRCRNPRYPFAFVYSSDSESPVRPP